MTERRLLSRMEAAAYCGLSVPVFERLCPVPALDLGGPRLHRWDRTRLDAWIENLQTPLPRRDDDGEDDDEWLARAGHGRGAD